MNAPIPTADVLRRAILGILVFGLVGTGVELLLLKHTDGFWQLFPIALIAATIVALLWHLAGRSAASIHAIRLLMLVNLASGLIGFVQHFLGNLGYARDSNPGLAGTELYTEALLGSTPTLAPGTMILLALLGLAFTFRHPSLTGSSSRQHPTTGTPP